MLYAALVSIFMAAAFLFLETLVFWPVGTMSEDLAMTGRLFSLFFALPLGLAAYFAKIVVPICLVVCGLMLLIVSATKRFRAFLVVLICATAIYSEFALLGYGVGWSFNRVFHRVFNATAERAQPIIAAIEAYGKLNATYPQELEHLVPDFLPEVPSTGLAGYPIFEYFVDTKDKDDASNYSLNIQTPAGLLNWDVFFYSPPNNDSEIGRIASDERLGEYERFGDWVYFYE